MDAPESLRALLDLAQDKLVVVDAEGTYQYANAAVERLLGYEPDAFVGTTTFEYIHPSEVDAVRATFEHLIEADEEVTETVQFRHRAADGSWVWLESRMWNRDDSELDGYVVSSRDITAQRAAKARRRETEATLQQLAANTDDVLWMFTADWEEVLFVNDAFEDIWGISQAALLDEPERFIEGVHRDDRSKVRWAMKRLSAGESVDIEYRIKSERPSQRWVWVQGHPIVEDGQITRIAGFVRDITDRRRRERQLQVLDNLLRHNLRNVINVIIGYADLAAEQGDSDVEAAMGTITDVAEELLTTVEKERRIVEVLINSSEQTVVDISALLSNCIAEIETAYPDATVTVPQPRPISVIAIPEIRDALKELLNNAAIHATCQPEIDVGIDTCGAFVSVQIKDNAPPIPGNEFEPLFAAADPSDIYHGTGLGLWLVYWIVDISDGELGFGRTAENDGNIVTIRLPRTTENRE